MATGLTSYPRRNTAPERADEPVHNWARNAVLAERAAVCAPSSEDELSDVLASARGRVRPTGSRMSPGRLLELADPRDTLLDLRGLRGLRALDDDSATFAGGTTLQEVYDVLAGVGRELPAAPGVIAEQTLGGALATGTHGQGLAQASLADAAVRLRLALADGSLLDLDADHPWFGAVQLGLGVLGVVSEVTLRTRPRTLYTCRKAVVDATALGEDLPRWNAEHALAKAWWFPDQETVHVWAAREATGTEAAAHRDGGGALLSLGDSDGAMDATVEHTLTRLRHDTRTSAADAKPLRTVTRFRDVADVTGDVYQVFCRGIATPQINVEVAVPLDRVGEVVDVLARWHRRTRPRLHYPVILRATGASSAWLSPASGRPTCYFGFVVYYAEDGSLATESLDAVRAVEAELAGCGSRPHWGKYFDEGLYDWEALYPRWRDFRRVRAALDPRGTFTNRFTSRLLGAEADR